MLIWKLVYDTWYLIYFLAFSKPSPNKLSLLIVLYICTDSKLRYFLERCNCCSALLLYGQTFCVTYCLLLPPFPSGSLIVSWARPGMSTQPSTPRSPYPMLWQCLTWRTGDSTEFSGYVHVPWDIKGRKELLDSLLENNCVDFRIFRWSETLQVHLNVFLYYCGAEPCFSLQSLPPDSDLSP